MRDAPLDLRAVEARLDRDAPLRVDIARALLAKVRAARMLVVMLLLPAREAAIPKAQEWLASCTDGEAAP